VIPKAVKVALLVILLGCVIDAQPVETGKFRLHKFQQAIGEETYQITRNGNTLEVNYLPVHAEFTGPDAEAAEKDFEFKTLPEFGAGL